MELFAAASMIQPDLDDAGSPYMALGVDTIRAAEGDVHNVAKCCA